VTPRPWWSPADEAERAVLVNELVALALEHRGKPGWADAVCAATDVILQWQTARELRSLAVYLRAQQDIGDWKAAA
jgi:hypothetical protein